MIDNIWNIKTPAESTGCARKSDYGVENHGLTNLDVVYWNLPRRLFTKRRSSDTKAKSLHMGHLLSTPANTRPVLRMINLSSAKRTEDNIWWGQYNRPYSRRKVHELFTRVQGFLQGHDLFVQDCYVGADPNYQMPIRVITEFAWHSCLPATCSFPVRPTMNTSPCARFHSDLCANLPIMPPG